MKSCRHQVIPILIGPHQTELDSILIGSAQVSRFQATIEERRTFIPIPIEDEVGDSGICGGLDLLLKDPWVRFILWSPSRFLRLMVPRELRLAALKDLPFGPPLPMNRLIPRIDVVVRKVIGTDFVSTLRRFLGSCHSGCGAGTRRNKLSSVHFHFVSLP